MRLTITNESHSTRVCVCILSDGFLLAVAAPLQCPHPLSNSHSDSEGWAACRRPGCESCGGKGKLHTTELARKGAAVWTSLLGSAPSAFLAFTLLWCTPLYTAASQSETG
ncbi:hypothetical protein DPEC_G00263300 [Dallia pectoralis]|uniref:Uncharacterized protein n=1 Tax=Dallia pectoralis TaxID=75939 RepID=A0ACC2FS84_DALPE|nr:hypothetical protein DPEC_G00263300 [Dallia pectoralis]